MKDKELVLSRLYDKMKLLLTHASKIDITRHITCMKFSSSNDISLMEFYDPAVVYLINGQLQILIGDKTVEYEKGQMFINMVSLPVALKSINASEENPCFAIKVNIKRNLLAHVMQEILYELDHEDLQENSNCAFTYMGSQYHDLCALERTIDLIFSKCTDAYPFMLLIRELYYYWLINDELAPLIANYVVKRNISVIKALDYIGHNYNKSIVVEKLAALCSMSESNFYKSFKQVTSMSPIQYIKRKRLLVARNLLVDFHYKAYDVGSMVGYVSEQHFSRDYSKLFGRPPKQDMLLLTKN